MSRRQRIYAVLAVAGLVATWTFNIRFMQAQGVGLWTFIQAGYANAASASLTNDVTLAAITFLVWSFAESRRLGMKRWWMWPLLTCFVALAFAFPIFLLLRERVMQQQAGTSDARLDV